MTATLEKAVEGPYPITKVGDNGTVTIKRKVRKGAKYETLNIRRIRPYTPAETQTNGETVSDG